MNPEQLQLARELEEFQAYERERFGLHRGQGQGQGGIGEQWLREIQGPASEQIAALPAPDGQIALIYTRNLAVACRTNLELYRQCEPSEHPSDSETEAFGTPPPIDGANQVTYRDRVRMHTFASLGISPRQIGTLTHRHRSTVVRILDEPTTPRLRRRRGHYKIDTPTRRRVVEYVQLRPNRFKCLEQVLHDTGLNVSRRILHSLLSEHNLGRFVARRNINISPVNRRSRLAYARAHEHWGIEDWIRVIWTDER
ncbi:hypothetical protein MMC28_004341 [Mycoblastus sanguinarius]|nr:hypothetical protein [Mycoblastus sanguinarius]